MRVLVAEDDDVSRRLLQTAVHTWGHDAVAVADGAAAWTCLEGDDPPPIALLDWNMPEVTGVEICRRLRARLGVVNPYVILITARRELDHIVAGLAAGADDYIVKPYHHQELHGRFEVGLRTIALRRQLAERVNDLEAALTRIKRLEGLISICAWCRKIRNEENNWQSVERYVAEHSEATFTHAMCPECIQKHARPAMDAARRRRETGA